MAKELSQEEYDKIIATVGSNGGRYIVIQSRPLIDFLNEFDEGELFIGPSKYGGYYCKIGQTTIKFSKLTQEELVIKAMQYLKDGEIPHNMYIDDVIDSGKKILFFQARIEPDELNWFDINPNSHLSYHVKAYYHTVYRRFRTPGNPDYINILKNQPYPYSQAELEAASIKLKEVLSKNLPEIKKRLSCTSLTIILVPRAKSIQDDNYQQLRVTVSGWCNEHVGAGFVDGCKYIIRHTDTPTTHLHEDGEIYPGITKSTCNISTEIAGKDILLIDDIYTPNVNVDEDVLQAVIDNKPNSITFYSIAKTPKPIKG